MTISKQLLSVAVMLAAGMVPAAPGATIYIVPPSQGVTLGQQVDAGIWVDGLGNGISPALASYDITVSYDSTLLSPALVSFTSALGDPADPSQVLTWNQFLFLSPGVGGVELGGISFLDTASLMAAQSTAATGFLIGDILFDTLSTGTSPLSVLVSSASDENGDALTLGTVDGSAEVNPPAGAVPEPANLLLGGGGALLLVLKRKFLRR